MAGGVAAGPGRLGGDAGRGRRGAAPGAGRGRGTRVSSNVKRPRFAVFRWGPTRLIIAGTVVTTWALNTETATTYVEQPPSHVDCGDSTVRHLTAPAIPTTALSARYSNGRDFASNPSHVPNTTLLRAPAPPLRLVPPARPPPSNAPNTTRPHPHPSVRRARQPVAQHDAPAQHDAQSAAPASTYFLVPIESSRR